VIGVWLSLARGQVEIVPEHDFVVFNLGQGILNFTLQSVTGASTFVNFETAGWRTDVNVTIPPGQSRFGIAGNLPVPNQLFFTLGPANPNSNGYFHLAATAFSDADNKQHELLVFKVQ
jgi:hypothetical protein